MEGNFSLGGMVPGGSSYGGFDLQNPIRVHHQGAKQIYHHPNSRQDSSVCPSLHEGFPLTVGTGHGCDRSFSPKDNNNNCTKGKTLGSDEEDPSFIDEYADGHNDANKGKKGSQWHRIKWTDKMVRLMITAVSYVGEDSLPECTSSRKFAALQKKGKWRSVSKVVAERGFHVSPQQCEDKFNDLNKRYKKLNDMLGRGTSCQVVENPALLDVIDYLTEKEKDDVRKILSSKQLFYEEMCSYHNGNRLHLPHDPALRRSLQLALRSQDDQDNDEARKHLDEDLDDDGHDMEPLDREDYEEHHSSHGILNGSFKRPRTGQGLEDVNFHTFLNIKDCDKGSFPKPQTSQAEINQVLQKQWIQSRALHLEEQNLQIQAEMLELEKQRFKWQRFIKKGDRELEKMRIENERMKLENERMALELKQRELGAS